MLKFFEVTWVFDLLIHPQDRKMHVCVSPEHGWYLRINSKDNYRPCCPLPKASNPFLKWDSHLECNLLEVDDYAIEEAVQEDGILGSVNRAHKDEVLKLLLRSPYTKERDKPVLEDIFGRH